MKRLLQLTFATAAMAMLLAASAGAAGAADIRIKNARTGEVKTVQFDAANADVDAPYLLRSSSGEQTQQIRGISLAKLIELAGADQVYSGIDVSRVGGGAVRVSKYAVLAQSLVPVVYQDGANLVFVRPSSGAGDLNAADVVSSGSGLDLTQVDLGALEVKIKVSKSKIKAGQSVKFSATATGGGAGDQYAFDWDFRDGSRGRGSEVTHKFKKRGTYKVLLSASIVGADRSDPAVVTIQVGEPSKSKKKREGGGTNDAANAPDSGAADGSSGNGDTATGDTSSRSKSKQEPEPAAQPEPELPVIEGELLAAESVQPIEQSSLAARSGQQPTATAKSFALPREAWAGIGALALIGAGMLFEFGTPGALRRRLRGIS